MLFIRLLLRPGWFCTLSTMSRLVTIEIEKQFLHFSAAHFTIFSATERERLHGHNYFVAAKLTGEVDENGLCFDYSQPKAKLRQACEALDEYMLLPGDSPHLQVEEQEDKYRVLYDQDEMLFLKSDTQILPVRNITIEELAGYFLDLITADSAWLSELRIKYVRMGVSSGPGQWAYCERELGD